MPKPENKQSALDPWIIEDQQRRERERRDRQDENNRQIKMPGRDSRKSIPPPEEKPKEERGVWETEI